MEAVGGREEQMVKMLTSEVITETWSPSIQWQSPKKIVWWQPSWGCKRKN